MRLELPNLQSLAPIWSAAATMGLVCWLHCTMSPVPGSVWVRLIAEDWVSIQECLLTTTLHYLSPDNKHCVQVRNHMGEAQSEEAFILVEAVDIFGMIERHLETRRITLKSLFMQFLRSQVQLVLSLSNPSCRSAACHPDVVYKETVRDAGCMHSHPAFTLLF